MLKGREYIQLRQNHGAALRYWGPFLLGRELNPTAHQRWQPRSSKKAFEELTAANGLMRFSHADLSGL
jgi:hypothetical protein